jgi:hypothetical protein
MVKAGGGPAEMERQRETTGEHMNGDNVLYLEQRQRTLRAREDRIHAEIEITATKLL